MPNIELVKAFMQVEGEIKINAITTNYNLKGGVNFTGYKEVNGESKPIEIVMDKNQTELVNECKTVMEVYECYKEMGYF